MSRRHYEKVDWHEPVSIDFVRIKHFTDSAILIVIEEAKKEADSWVEWIARSIIANLEEVEQDLKRPVNRRKLTSIEVPKWKAKELGLD